jgi:hypothetical protein
MYFAASEVGIALCLDRTLNIHIGRGLPNGIEVKQFSKIWYHIISESK